ncbi:MAG: endonuclease domain-containing protein [Phycisphaeraceae bacterium]|nr:endonuclease domain-containing protein [Phycisphaeraceae bacterium]
MSRENRQHRTPKPSTERARDLRAESTIPERVLWGMLRARRLGRLKFRRQVPFGPYVTDFYCAEHRLVVELDGESHDGQRDRDAKRTAYLESVGLRVIRVTNSELASNPEGVARFILSQAQADR